VYYHHKVN